MRTELAEQYAMLERELANLDQLLASVADWKALAVIEAHKKSLSPGSDTSKLDMESRKLRARLADNRIFSARERIVEAIALIRQELERDPLGAPVVAKTMEDQSKYDEPAPAVKPAQPETTPAPIKEIAAHSQTAPSQADTISPSSPPCMMSQVASQMAKTEHLYKPAVRESSSKDEILAPGAARVREQTKVTIHKMPPDSEGVDKNLARGSTDDLSKIRGISSETAQKLNALGVRRYRQIAAWTAKDVASVRVALGVGMRIARENWIDQAAVLAAIDEYPKEETQVAVLQVQDPSGSQPRTSSQPPRPETKTDKVSRKSPVALAAATIIANLDHATAHNPTSQQKQTKNNAESERAKNNHLGVEKDSEREKNSSVATAAATILASLGGADPASEPDPDNNKPRTTGETGETGDSLQEIRFISDALAQRLANAGITQYAQIAKWSAEDIARFSAKLNLGQRIAREAWIEQAEILAIGGTTAYARERQQAQHTKAPPPLPISGSNSAFKEDSTQTTTLAERLKDGNDLEGQQSPPEATTASTDPARHEKTQEHDDESGANVGDIVHKPETGIKTQTGPSRTTTDLSGSQLHQASTTDGEEFFDDVEDAKFDDAEVDIVAIKRDKPKPRLEETSRSKEASSPQKTSSRPFAQSKRHPAEAFDAGHDTGYGGQTPEASVSIIPGRSPSRADRPGAPHRTTKPLIRK